MTDTIPIRSDEHLDEARLAEYLRGKLPDADGTLAIRQFGGGAANLTYLLTFEHREFVLRRPPLGPVAPSAHDMAREYRVLSVLHQAFPPAPQAFHFCDDPAIIGAPFFVMERRKGVVIRRTLLDEYQSIPEAPQRLSRALVDTLADFHAVDFHALGLSDLGKPDGFLSRQIEGWNKRWHGAKLHDLPEMDAVYAWLRSNIPLTSEVTLVHNDYKLDNVMLAPTDPGRVVAVFDWDMCTLGDPLSDLGALLTYWTGPEDPPLMQEIARTFMPVGDSRFFTRTELVACYAERSGRDVSNVRFYHVLGLFRLAVIIAQIYIRYFRGQTKDQRFEAFGSMIPFVVQVAYQQIGG
ncbi:MAG TPA: phosphotransferase family protein [Anaerolineales bacterium]|nr:phosphotransferase family protein [Anaerolineales bacterium]